MTGPLLVIAAGGTGGHMFPAHALAEEMLKRGWRVKLSTDARGARFAGGFPEAVEITQVASATFARGGIAAKLLVPFRIIAGIGAAKWRMLKDRPAAVVGFGGYPAIPAMAAAWALRVPRMIHEQNGVLGRVNQVFARRVDKVACGTWPTALPNGIEGIHTGNPVRPEIREIRDLPFPAFSATQPINILVTGGSQAARLLSDMVPPALAALPEPLRRHVRVFHQARPEDTGRVSAAYSEAGISAEVLSFFTDMPRRIAEAQLVIARSGASTVADVSIIGRPSIFIPLAAAIRDEQTANARALVEAGAAVLIPEYALDVPTLSAQIAAILGAPDNAATMAAAALGCGRPDATDRLAALVEELAGQRSQA